MSKFFRAFCCCSSSKVSSPSEANRPRQPVARNANQSRNQRPQQSVPVITQERRRSHHVPKPEKKFLKIKSSHTSQNLRYADSQTPEDKDLKFNCPICFRFFDRILVGNCCHNYLCHFCAEDVNERVKNDDKVLVARCPFCDNDDFVLYDVDVKEKPKKYTDSFYSTIKSGGRGKFESKLFMMNNNLQASHVDPNSPSPEEEALKDRRAASDGAIYLQRELMKAKANRTVGTNPGDDTANNIDFIENVLPAQSVVRIEYPNDNQSNSEFRKSFNPGQEGHDALSEDSLNQRDPLPIDVIKEDEYESSVLPETALRQPEDH